MLAMWWIALLMAVCGADLRVVSAGTWRTGLLSLREALKELDSTLEIYEFKAQHLPAWHALYHSENESEVRKLMRGYDCAADFVSQGAFEALIKAYPDAKVIITTRTSSTLWLESLSETVLALHPHDPYRFTDLSRLGTALFMISSPVGWAMHYYSLLPTDLSRIKSTYEDRVARVAELTDNYLVFRTGIDGYKELCEFLHVDCPPNDKEYPHLNTRAQFKALVLMPLSMLGIATVATYACAPLVLRKYSWAPKESFKLAQRWGFI